MIYGELGIKPIQVDIDTRMISFWSKLTDFSSNKLSNNMYLIINCLHNQGKLNSKWLSYVKELVVKNGFSNIWDKQKEINRKWFPLAFKQKISDQYLQYWNSIVDKSTSGINYRLFKTNFEINKYFHLLPNYYCRIITAFRTRNHKFPNEIGRWAGIALNNRKCTLCRENEIGDEFHYLLCCKFFLEQRKINIKQYYSKYPNIIKFYELLNTDNKTVLFKLSM